MNAKPSSPPAHARTAAKKQHQLPPNNLSHPCDPQQLGFATTAQLPDLQDVIGQPRAFRALELGSEVRSIGYNVFVLGIPDSGRSTLTREYLKRKAAHEPTADDWVYVNNFADPRRPIALSLPAGRAVEFRKDMLALLEDCRQSIPRAFASEEYKHERDQLIDRHKQVIDQAFKELETQANQYGFVLLKTPYGLFLGPAVDGKLISPENFDKLGEENQQKLKKIQGFLSEKLESTITRVREMEQKTTAEVLDLDQRVLKFLLQPLFQKLREKYAALTQVCTYLDQVEQDLIENGSRYRGEEDGEKTPLEARVWTNRYEVNILVDNTNLSGAPVLTETQPSYHNLLGRIEHEIVMGISTTDFTQIRAGALHRANNGYLILPARDVLVNPYAWEGLKRVLRDREIRILELSDQMGVISTTTLEPQPIPLNLKVILIGTPVLFYMLRAYDEDFAKLFKVRAEFATEMERTPESEHEYGLFVHSVVEDNSLAPFDPTAVARIIEYGSRLVENQQKLSTQFGIITDLVCEADYWAKKEGKNVVDRSAVEKAIRERIYRSNRIEEIIQEMIQQGMLLVDVNGRETGQINALSVIALGDAAFGRPNRVTAAVYAGEGGVVDIERQATLGGAIHTKGVLILSGFLGQRYAQQLPLTLTASLTFEQSYDEVEGDSASAAELLALLSALAEIPLDQQKAITGSVNQHGQIQAIGGVNEKIEGFFAVCRQAGLSGEQGVIIPLANQRSLMLEEEVIAAVREGKFHIWTVNTIDEAIELMTGYRAGERKKDGTFPAGSFNHAVQEQLTRFARVITAGRRKPATPKQTNRARSRTTG